MNYFIIFFFGTCVLGSVLSFVIIVMIWIITRLKGNKKKWQLSEQLPLMVKPISLIRSSFRSRYRARGWCG